MKIQLTTLPKRLLAAVVGVSLAVTTALGQGSVTSSGINGVVRNEQGSALSSASITVVHQPTGTRYTATSGSNGRFNLRGLRVGGPYTITARLDGYRTSVEQNVFLDLSQAYRSNLSMKVSDDVVVMDEFVVDGSELGIFASDSAGSSSVLGERAIADTPQVRRNFNDFARFNPYATISEDDRNELSVAGQSNRFNSIQIDGLRVNDQFGLESDGVQSFNNPIAIDAVEQLTVEVTPYDVTQSGFTGASINAVTKSGTNDFNGSVYYVYTDDGLRGDSPTDGSNPLLEETTYGLTFGGPLIKDKLFFFLSYENFEELSQPSDPGFEPDPAALNQLFSYISTLGVDFGTFESVDVAKEEEEKFLAKIDWNISDQHRLSLKYASTDGNRPNFGNYDDFAESALTSNFYMQEKEEETYTLQFYSNWTPNFQTEFSVGYNDFFQPTTSDSRLPQIEIDDFPGADGREYELFFGTEQFRHFNSLAVETLNLKGKGDLFAGDHTITFGFDYEESEFSNLFLQGGLGVFTFEDLPAFLADTPQSPNFRTFRNTGVQGQDPVAVSDFNVLGLYLQDSWQYNDRLTLTGGLRVDITSQDSQAPVAVRPSGVSFEDEFGFANNGTVDGNTLVAPRFGATYYLNEDRTTRLRGGVGLFQGRTPFVWVSNAFTNNGVTNSQQDVGDDPNLGSLQSYLNSFNDGIVLIDPSQGTPSVDAIAPGLELPSSWKANIALDQDFEAFGQPFTATAEVLLSDVNKGLTMQQINLNPAGTAPDGRQLYSGSRTNEFRQVYLITNTNRGSASNMLLQLEKRFQNNWYSSLSYTYGQSDEVNPFTSSRAVSNWGNVIRADPNGDELATSNFEVNHRFLFNIGYNIDWSEGWTTRLNLNYEGRTGRPYSAAFGSDINGDGDSNNDLFYVPSGANDPLVNAAASSGFAELMAYIDSSNLAEFKGQIAPRNALQNDWVHRWDLNLTQQIPLSGDFRAEVFANFINIGNMIDDEWGLIEEFGFPFEQNVSRGSIVNGQYVYDYRGAEEARVRVGERRSRWAIQVGMKLLF
ncbi:MAG: TonB-dependent receptor [Synoicihabitans sp.]